MTAALRAVGLAILCAASMLMAGCGSTVRTAAYDVPRIAVPITIDETIGALEDPVTRERIARVLATPEMRRAIEEIAASATRGALAEASTEQVDARLEELVVRLTATFSRAFIGDLREELGEAAASPEYAAAQRRIERDLSSLVAAATRSSLRTAAEELPETIGPAVRTSLVNELRSPELREGLAITVSEITRQTLVSSRDVIREMRAEADTAGVGSVFDQFRQMVALAWSASIVLVAALFALLAWALQTRRRTKRFRAAVLDIFERKKKGTIDDEDLHELLHAVAP